MKKLAVILLFLIFLIGNLAHADEVLLTKKKSGGCTPPTLLSATIGTNGTIWNFVFSESVSIGAGGNGGWAVTMNQAGSISFTYSSGSGTDTLVYTSTAQWHGGIIYSTESKTSGLNYSQPGNGIEATDDGCDVISFSGTSVTNNSTQTPSYLLSETFDGASACGDGSHTNCDNTWSMMMGTWTTRDFNYATSPAPLEGTYSFYGDCQSAFQCVISKTFAGNTAVSAYFQSNVGSIVGVGDAGSAWFYLWDNPITTDLCYSSIRSVAGTYRVCALDVCGSSVAISQGTTYHVWQEYSSGAYCRVYISTNATKPSSPEANKTSGVPSGTAAYMGLDNIDSTYDRDQATFDRILVDNVSVGSNP